MIRSQDPDPQEGCNRIGRWTYLKVANGGSANGFLAGKPVGVWGHHLGGTKPCRKKMTGGRHPCPYCSEGVALVWRGYTPVFDQDYVQRFVCIPADIKKSVDEIGEHQQVRMTRAKSSKAPVILRAEQWRMHPFPKAGAPKWPVDLMPYLVKYVWKDEVLAAFCAGDSPDLFGDDAAAVVVNRLSPADTLKRSTEVIRDQMVVRPADDPYAEATARIRKKVADMDRNGKHPKG